MGCGDDDISDVVGAHEGYGITANDARRAGCIANEKACFVERRRRARGSRRGSHCMGAFHACLSRRAAGGACGLVDMADAAGRRHRGTVTDSRAVMVDGRRSDGELIEIGQRIDPRSVPSDPGIVQDDAPEAGAYAKVPGVNRAMRGGDGNLSRRICPELGRGVQNENLGFAHHLLPCAPATDGNIVFTMVSKLLTFRVRNYF